MHIKSGIHKGGNLRKRFFAAGCAAFMLVSTTVSAKTPQEMLEALKKANVLQGNPDGSTNGNITRQELAILLAKGMNLDIGSGTPQQSTFSDVSDSGSYSSAYTTAIDAAIKAGQIDSPSDVFQAPLTREQLAAAMTQALGVQNTNVPYQPGNESEWAADFIQAAVEKNSIPTDLDARPENAVALTVAASVENNQANENTTQNSVQKTADAAGGGYTTEWASQPHPGWDDFSYFGDGLLSASAPPVQSGTYTYNGRMAGAFADGGTFDGAALILNFNLSSASIDGSLDFSNGIAPVTGSWSGNNINAAFSGSDVDLGALNGNLKGGFFGPHQEQIGGTWSMTAGSRAASGQFAGSR